MFFFFMADKMYLDAQSSLKFYEYINELLLCKKFTTVGLAKAMGCNRSTIYRAIAKKGKVRVKRAYARNLSTVTGCRLSDFSRTRVDNTAGINGALRRVRECRSPRLRVISTQHLVGSVQMYLYDDLGCSITCGYSSDMAGRPNYAWWLVFPGKDCYAIVADLTVGGTINNVSLKLSESEDAAEVQLFLHMCSHTQEKLNDKLTSIAEDLKIVYSDFTVASLRQFLTLIRRDTDMSLTSYHEIQKMKNKR